MNAPIKSDAPNTAELYSNLSDDELAEHARDAEATKRELAAAVAEATSYAATAREAFVARPAPDTHTDSAIATQLEQNAAAAARAAADEAAAATIEIARRAHLRRVAELTPVANVEALVSALYARARKKVLAFSVELAQEGRYALEQIEGRNRASEELARLTGMEHDRLQHSAVQDALYRRLLTEFGTRYPGADGVAVLTDRVTLGFDERANVFASFGATVTFAKPPPADLKPEPVSE